MNTKAAKKVLLVLTSQDTLGQTLTPTGSWLEELAAAYWAFADAGYMVELASVRGGAAPIDPMSQQSPWVTPTGERFMSSTKAQDQLRSTHTLQDVDASQFEAVYLIGGAGTAYDFPTNAPLGRLVSQVFSRGAPVAAVCHGVLGLLEARDGSGRALVTGKRVTGISNAEEAVAQYDKILPLLPENALTKAGAQYAAAAPFAAHVVQHENLLTGQNPASAAPLAQAVLSRLRA